MQVCSLHVKTSNLQNVGPVPSTVIDFWRMVWQEKPSAIVMLTNLEEGNKIKCEQYWPGSGKKIYGPFSVIITDQQILADYVVRTFVISVSGTIRG